MSILEVGKIALVPLQETDLQAVYELNMDYDICSGAGFWPDMPTYEAFLGWMEPFLKEVNKEKYHFAIVPRSTVENKCVDGNRFVCGVVSAFNVNDFHKTAYVGIRIRKTLQKQGYATTAMKALLWYLCKIRGMRKVYAEVYDNNEPSQKLFQKLGFVEEARLQKHEFHLGEYRDVIVYSKYGVDVDSPWEGED